MHAAHKLTARPDALRDTLLTNIPDVEKEPFACLGLYIDPGPAQNRPIWESLQPILLYLFD